MLEGSRAARAVRIEERGPGQHSNRRMFSCNYRNIYANGVCSFLIECSSILLRMYICPGIVISIIFMVVRLLALDDWDWDWE